MNEDFHDGARQISGWDTAWAVSVFVAVEVLVMGYVSIQLFTG